MEQLELQLNEKEKIILEMQNTQKDNYRNQTELNNVVTFLKKQLANSDVDILKIKEEYELKINNLKDNYDAKLNIIQLELIQ